MYFENVLRAVLHVFNVILVRIFSLKTKDTFRWNAALPLIFLTRFMLNCTFDQCRH
jgi:hypothetical protein